MLHSLRAARLPRGRARGPDASSSHLIAVGDEVVIWGALAVAAPGTRPACRPTPREQGLPIQNGRIVGKRIEPNFGSWNQIRDSSLSAVLLQKGGDPGRAARVGHVERRNPVPCDDVGVGAFLEEDSDELLAVCYVVRVKPVDVLDSQPRRPVQWRG